MVVITLKIILNETVGYQIFAGALYQFSAIRK